MPAQPPARTASRRSTRSFAAVFTALLVACGSVIFTAPAAHAASPGAGFGAWAPISAYGWHGSMIVDGVHTYCILPGVALPTGPTVDNGVSGTAAGLSPEQLTGINLLVTAYGQTDDPVQAAAVGWAVKAIANRDETLHHFGYGGESLAEAIHWTFSALAPEHSAEVQRRAVAFYDEARAVTAGTAGASGTMVFSTDAADPSLGSVRVDATTSAASGTLTLVGANFVATGTPTLPDAAPGTDYPIVATPTAPGRPYAVTGTGRFRLSAVAAVRHFTTAGGQDTAGPAGEVTFDVAGADAALRVPAFAPTISTQVQSATVQGGPFIDDVSFDGEIADWPRAEDGSYLPVTATAAVYRTDHPPVLGAVPHDAEHVGSLALTTEGATGPDRPYRVTSVWELPGPGYYTAVWSIGSEAQPADVARALGPQYLWTEDFGEPTQITSWAESPPETPSAAPPDAVPSTLAATGASAPSPRTVAGAAIGMLTLGLTLVGLARRREGADASA
jgi:hypothetical protein